MAKIKGLKLTESEVSQTIDLNELFGVNFAAGNSGLVQAIGQDIIDTIVSRTESGLDVNGKDLKSPYSDEYADSLEFKAFGKDKKKVNMKLTGQMLGTLDLLENDGGKIKIGWDDETENAKSYNHNVGDTVPKRPFFGANESDLKNIKEKYKDQVDAASRSVQSEGSRIINDIINLLNPRNNFQFGTSLGKKK